VKQGSATNGTYVARHLPSFDSPGQSTLVANRCARSSGRARIATTWACPAGTTLRPVVRPGEDRASTAEDERLAMAWAWRRPGPGEVVEDQVGQPEWQVDGAVAGVLGRAPHRLTGVELI
jgi:hypothetical protein